MQQTVQLDTTGAGQSLDGLNQKAKTLLATLQQIKASLSSIPSMNPTGGASGAAASTATPGAGASGLPNVQGVAGNGLAGAVPNVNASGSLNPSIQQSMLQSTQVGMSSPFGTGQSGGAMPPNYAGMQLSVGGFSLNASAMWGGLPQQGTPPYGGSPYQPQNRPGNSTVPSFIRAVAPAAAQQVTQSLGAGLGVYTNNILAGQVDPLAAASIIAGTYVGMAGGASGAASDPLTPGLGFMAGFNAAYPTGAAAGAAMIAPQVRSRDAVMQIGSVASAYGRDALGVVNKTGSGGLRTLDNFESIVENVNGKMSLKDRMLLKAGLYTGTDYTSVPKLSQMYATLGSAALSAGDSDIGLMGSVGGMPYGMLDRLADRFGIAGPQAADSAGRILGIHNRYADSRADLIFNGGIEDFDNYAVATGGRKVSDREREAYRTDQVIGHVQRTSRAMLHGQTASYNAELLTDAPISKLKNNADRVQRGLEGQLNISRTRARNIGQAFGTDSEEYANAMSDVGDSEYSAQSNKINTFDTMTHRRDTSEYTIPSMRLQGQMERLQYLPFSAGAPMKLAIQQLNLNKKQLSVINQDEASLRQSGLDNPDKQAEFEAKRQTLLTQNARAIGIMSEGMEDRLPALSAGAPAQAGRLSSFQMAAANLNMMVSPQRGFGAINGKQLKMQDDFLSQLGADRDEIAPRSRTQNMNADGGALAPVLDRLARVLEKLTASGSEPLRPGEMAGQLSGHLSQKDLGGQSPYRGRN